MRKIDLKKVGSIIRDKVTGVVGHVRSHPGTFASGLAGLAAVGVIGLLAVSAVGVHRDNVRVYAQMSALDDRIQSLSKESEMWTAEKRALGSDPFYVEILLLEKNMVKPGEKIVKARR